LESQTIFTILQFGFGGVLLVFLMVVSKQFLELVKVLDNHLQRLTALLDRCMGDKEP